MKNKTILIAALALMLAITIGSVSATHGFGCWGWFCPPIQPPIITPPVVNETEPVTTPEPAIIRGPRGKPYNYVPYCVEDPATGLAVYYKTNHEVLLNMPGKYQQLGDVLISDYSQQTCDELIPVIVSAPSKSKWRI